MSSELTTVQEYNRQGLILFAKDKYDEALEYFNKAIDEEQCNIEAYINSAQVYIMKDEFDEAVKFLNKALLIDKKCAIVYFHLGNVELLRNDNVAAREYYAKAISLGYDNEQIYINLAADAEENGDFETALSYYNKVIALNKFNAYVKARKIEIYGNLKRIPEALKACDSLIETNPDIFEGHHYKFVLLCDTGKLEEADTVLERALKLFPDDEAFFYDKAKLLQKQGKIEEALALLNEKISINDDSRTGVTAFKAQLLLGLGKYDEAEVILAAEYANTPDSEIAYLLNSIYMAKKEYDKVVECTSYIIENNEINAYYYAALYYNAIALSRLGRPEANTAFEEALKIYRVATSRRPGEIQLYFYRAMCHQQLKQYDKALELVDFILNLDDNLAEVHLLRAKICEETGRKAEAIEEKNKAVSIKPELKDMMEDE